MYRDLSNGVIEFFHFLTERIKAFYNKNLILDDELDHYGLYLEYNEYHNIAENKKFKNAHILFLGFRDERDRYFNKLYFDPEKAIKPRKNNPLILKDVIDNLELKRKPGFIEIGIIIYSLSDEARDKTGESILNIISLQHNEKRIRPACFPWEVHQSDLSVSLIIRMPDIHPDFTTTEYAIKNMFIQEKEKALFLDISVDERNKVTDVSFEWVKKNNLNKEEVQKYEEEAKKTCRI